MYSYVVVSSCDVNSLYSLRINTDEHPKFQFVFTEGSSGQQGIAAFCVSCRCVLIREFTRLIRSFMMNACSSRAGYCIVRDAGVAASDPARVGCLGDHAEGQPDGSGTAGVWEPVSAAELGI